MSTSEVEALFAQTLLGHYEGEDAWGGGFRSAAERQPRDAPQMAPGDTTVDSGGEFNHFYPRMF
jgi:hypothetical protein